jgi:hypothetical protein
MTLRPDLQHCTHVFPWELDGELEFAAFVRRAVLLRASTTSELRIGAERTGPVSLPVHLDSRKVSQ